MIKYLPSANKSSVLNTAACFCITYYISNLTSAVFSVPLAYLYLSILAIDSSPAFLGKGLWGAPGLINSFTVLAAALPNTTISNKELAPSLLAPCTEAQAASPAANNPGTILSFPFLS